MVWCSVIHLRSLQSATNEDLVIADDGSRLQRRPGMSGEALHKNSGAAPDRHSCGFREKEEERRLRVCVVGVGEAVPDQPC